MLTRSFSGVYIELKESWIWASIIKHTHIPGIENLTGLFDDDYQQQQQNSCVMCDVGFLLRYPRRSMNGMFEFYRMEASEWMNETEMFALIMLYLPSKTWRRFSEVVAFSVSVSNVWWKRRWRFHLRTVKNIVDFWHEFVHSQRLFEFLSCIIFKLLWWFFSVQSWELMVLIR